jgi:hypothetical protein
MPDHFTAIREFSLKIDFLIIKVQKVVRKFPMIFNPITKILNGCFFYDAIL